MCILCVLYPSAVELERLSRLWYDGGDTSSASSCRKRVFIVEADSILILLKGDGEVDCS
jgi:hypothetical protein